jgi:hypothetical protein
VRRVLAELSLQALAVKAQAPAAWEMLLRTRRHELDVSRSGGEALNRSMGSPYVVDLLEHARSI